MSILSRRTKNTKEKSRRTKRLQVEVLENRKMMTGAAVFGLPSMPVVTGDFNNDGYEDVATGVPDYAINGQSSAGVVRVVYGNSSATGYAGGSSSQWWYQGGHGVAGVPGRNDRFGASLAVGDLNGDRIDDLVIGASGDDSIRILLGRNGNNLVALSESIPSLDGVGGHSVAIGDFNGDGYNDIAVGDPDQLAVRILFQGNGFARQRMLYPRDRFPDPEPYFFSDPFRIEAIDVSYGGGTFGRDDCPYEARLRDFGWSLAAGNFNGDEYDDLAIGSPNAFVRSQDCRYVGAIFEADAAGVVTVLSGSRRFGQGESRWGFPDTPFSNLVNPVEGSYFGASLAVGDLNADGTDDLAVGKPGYWYGKGGVEVYYARSYGLPQVGQYWYQSRIGYGGETDDYFGASLAIGDVDQNGVNDLVVGIPGKDVRKVDQGAIAVIKGVWRRGLVSDPWWSPYHTDVLHQDNLDTMNWNNGTYQEYFGASMAAGDIDGKGVVEIVVGVPREYLYEEDRSFRGLTNLARRGTTPSTNVISLNRAQDFGKSSVLPYYEAKDYLWALFGDYRTTGKYGSYLRGELNLTDDDYYGGY